MRLHVYALSLSGEPVSPSYGIYSFGRRVVCVSRQRNTTIMVVSFAAENFKYSSTMPRGLLRVSDTFKRTSWKFLNDDGACRFFGFRPFARLFDPFVIAITFFSNFVKIQSEESSIKWMDSYVANASQLFSSKFHEQDR